MALDRRSLTIGGLALLVAATVGVAAGAVAGARDDTSRPAADSAAAPVPPAESTTAAPPPAAGGVAGAGTPTPSASPSVGGDRATRRVPVYVLGDTGAGPRLFREFRSAAGADGVWAALAAMADRPADPDYRTPWAGARVLGVTRAGTDVTVRLSAAPRLGSAAEARLAVQQVVHTATAADTRVRRVRVVAPGLPAALTAAPIGRGAQLDVLAPVWLLDPADGARSGRRVTLTGTASVFEGTVNVEARQGTRVVGRATATASVGAPGRGDWTATLTLPPGTYVLAAYETSEKDGSRSSEDTKRVRVG